MPLASVTAALASIMMSLMSLSSFIWTFCQLVGHLQGRGKRRERRHGHIDNDSKNVAFHYYTSATLPTLSLPSLRYLLDLFEPLM